MFIDGIPFGGTLADTGKGRSIAAFIAYLEKKLGISAVYDRRRIPFGRDDLTAAFDIASLLLERNIIKEYGPGPRFPDEPPLKIWGCTRSDAKVTGGASVNSDSAALFAALAEALERSLWWDQRDYYVRPRRASAKDMAAHFRIIEPERFASFSEEQRTGDPTIRLEPDAPYLWIEGVSLVSGKRTYVPAQTVSAAHLARAAVPKEPLIRVQTTNGLATWPTKAGAQLAGALELIERDAYMVTWFNQLTLPRAKISALRERSATFDMLVSRCERYGISVHIIPLITDAPTYAVCAVVEDKGGVGPRFCVGLKADRSLAHAAERATVEALRGRLFARRGDYRKEFDTAKPVDKIGHRERIYYWQVPENASHLEFLVSGEEKEFPEAAWERDTVEQHLQRLVTWCKEREYEWVTVPLGTSRANPTKWHVEMTLIPELTPTHLLEERRHLGGKRLKSVPPLFGYTPRELPFIERPHPFS